MSKLRVEMVEYEKEEPPKQFTSTMLGGNRRNPSWDEYIEQIKPEYQHHFKVLRRYIKDRLWRKTGAEICNDYWFRFSDGTNVAFSWRAWGDLMQAVVNKREGYMEYYM